jgi:hypothetical protein
LGNWIDFMDLISVNILTGQGVNVNMLTVGWAFERCDWVDVFIEGDSKRYNKYPFWDKALINHKIGPIAPEMKF